MTRRKKLIEVALPLEAINEAGAKEKANPFIKGHPRTIHTWFARRPLVTCRAVIFASMVDDPADPSSPTEFVERCASLPRGTYSSVNDTPRKRLFDFIERLVQWDSTTDEEVLRTAQELIRLSTGESPPVMDPFAGGGSIPLEAQRLGLEAVAGDLNPVAVAINRALIDIPVRFANRPPVKPRSSGNSLIARGEWHGLQGLAADVRYYGQRLLDDVKEELETYYPRGPQNELVFAWLWARSVRCPNPACGAEMPLASSFRLSTKKGRRAWVEPVIDHADKSVCFEVSHGDGSVPNPPKVGRGAKFKCLVCNEIAPGEHIKREAMTGRMGAKLLAIATEGEDGLNYHSPTEDHEMIALRAHANWEPVGDLADDPRALTCRLYGVTGFSDLFTSRQLNTLTTFRDRIDAIKTRVVQDALRAGWSDDGIVLRKGGNSACAYAEAIAVYMAFALDRWTDYSTSLCAWNVTNENVKHTFGRNALPMVWDFAEVNLLGDKLGFQVPVEWVARVLDELQYLAMPSIRPGRVMQMDAASSSNYESGVAIATDPPYYDNIGYSDIGDFYYVWLRNTLQDIYPEDFDTLLTPKAPELVSAPHRFQGARELADRHFEEGLASAFSQMRDYSHPDYPLTLFYAFKESDVIDTSRNEEAYSSTGWETMLKGLIRSGLQITGTWPVRTERRGRVRDIESNALASSVVLVCRRRSTDAPMIARREFLKVLRRELPDALRQMQTGNIAPVDLAQASIGPGMAVYTRYRKVLEPNGDQLTVRTALQLINRELDTYLAEREGQIDPDSRFAVAWFEQFGFAEGPFGQADVLARAKNTSVEGLEAAGVLSTSAGKVQLLHWEQLDASWDPSEDKRLTTWEATHHLIERLSQQGEEGAAHLLSKMPSALSAEARQLAYRLYSICERKGWAELARDYNALVISWSASQEHAYELQGQHEQAAFQWDAD